MYYAIMHKQKAPIHKLSRSKAPKHSRFTLTALPFKAGVDNF